MPTKHTQCDCALQCTTKGNAYTCTRGVNCAKCISLQLVKVRTSDASRGAIPFALPPLCCHMFVSIVVGSHVIKKTHTHTDRPHEAHKMFAVGGAKPLEKHRRSGDNVRETNPKPYFWILI